MDKQAIITFGIPGSGKSYWAKNYVGSNESNWVEINLDDCRKAICGDEGNQKVTSDAVKLRDLIMDKSIRENKNIIVSDTNLNRKFRNELVKKLTDFGYDVSIKVFDVDFETCKQRNNDRARVVPHNAMIRMWEHFLNEINHVKENEKIML